MYQLWFLKEKYCDHEALELEVYYILSLIE